MKAEFEKYEIVRLTQDQEYLLRLVYPRGVKTASPFVHKRVHNGFYIPNTNAITLYECAGPNCSLCKMSAAFQKEHGSDKYKVKKRYYYLLFAKTGLFKILELDWFAQRALLGVESNAKSVLANSMSEGLDIFCPEKGRAAIFSRKSQNNRETKYEFIGVSVESALSDDELKKLKTVSPDLESAVYRPTIKESEEIARWTWQKITERKVA
ncbi:hypothetical protein [Bdellovibrio sp. BCCA]|uniref:hypothetical protein n=1 Tax=Bdellovibrio sp. BCCA TaxID=3136281 RepID=UPI0030F1AB86